MRAFPNSSVQNRLPYRNTISGGPGEFGNHECEGFLISRKFLEWKARWELGLTGELKGAEHQKFALTPSCAANGIPTVVPGPKKSPNPPAGNAS